MNHLIEYFLRSLKTAFFLKVVTIRKDRQHGFDRFSSVFLFVLFLFSDRFQSVSVKGRVSSQNNVHYGVRQCSVLGPILFSL